MGFSLQLSRTFSTTSLLMVRRLAKRSNPGLGYQLTAIEDAAKVIQSDPEGFEGLESDLFNAHKSHKQHELDLQRQKDKIRQRIIERKYFKKDQLPNLLTYAEKEQIKFLHSSDKEEWTVEKLSESFPASAETICKILKSNWSPLSSKRILSHDTSVFRNWERFKKGEYNGKISSDMYEHLKKFVDREPNINILHDPTKSFQKMQWQKPKSNEFSSIISSLRPKTNDQVNTKALTDGKAKEKSGTIGSSESDSYLLGEIQNKKPITIHQLKSSHLSDKSLQDNSKSLDQLAAQKLKNSSGTGIIKEKGITSNTIAAFDYTEKFVSNEVVINEVDKKRYGMSTTKERIHIPRKLWRKGATYRANDCYYDDDGEFLYRVPGMTSK
ncbi:uncharacterized protein LOC111690250 [Lucilia cuprina]|uniref:uncharacterized protein LOC111690250 n=1 Tax=Lucilia cuprina TaxID=7375 RepID=UPI001F058F22|nr:uncharacterized protein LOC111690250 [Lucilia cuprina]XP_046806115.1 uncharacterized protein LOC111690250 [Lucilia cuprina]XP_046806116.1 uncharacterized protein LOC111690250 [Lucilia cuprina]